MVFSDMKQIKSILHFCLNYTSRKKKKNSIQNQKQMKERLHWIVAERNQPVDQFPDLSQFADLNEGPARFSLGRTLIKYLKVVLLGFLLP